MESGRALSPAFFASNSNSYCLQLSIKKRAGKIVQALLLLVAVYLFIS